MEREKVNTRIEKLEAELEKKSARVRELEGILRDARDYPEVALVRFSERLSQASIEAGAWQKQAEKAEAALAERDRELASLREKVGRFVMVMPMYSPQDFSTRERWLEISDATKELREALFRHEPKPEVKP